MADKLNVRTKQFHCVVSLGLQKDLDRLNNETFAFFISSIEGLLEYYLIYHDDTDTKHYHVALIFKNTIRISTLINLLSDKLSISPLAVSVEKMTSLCSSLRYFTHYGLKDKKQYSIMDIVSNMDFKYIQTLFNSDDTGITFERLLEVCMTSKNEIEVMYILGLSYFHKYRSEIHTILDNQYASLEMYDKIRNET